MTATARRPKDSADADNPVFATADGRAGVAFVRRLGADEAADGNRFAADTAIGTRLPAVTCSRAVDQFRLPIFTRPARRSMIAALPLR